MPVLMDPDPDDEEGRQMKEFRHLLKECLGNNFESVPSERIQNLHLQLVKRFISERRSSTQNLANLFARTEYTRKTLEDQNKTKDQRIAAQDETINKLFQQGITLNNKIKTLEEQITSFGVVPVTSPIANDKNIYLPKEQEANPWYPPTELDKDTLRRHETECAAAVGSGQLTAQQVSNIVKGSRSFLDFDEAQGKGKGKSKGKDWEGFKGGNRSPQETEREKSVRDRASIVEGVSKLMNQARVQGGLSSGNPLNLAYQKEVQEKYVVHSLDERIQTRARVETMQEGLKHVYPGAFEQNRPAPSGGITQPRLPQIDRTADAMDDGGHGYGQAAWNPSGKDERGNVIPYGSAGDSQAPPAQTTEVL